jgi:hypothetical protein
MDLPDAPVNQLIARLAEEQHGVVGEGSSKGLG